MKQKYAAQAIRKIARREGLPEQAVVDAMEEALAQAWEAALTSGDPQLLRLWNSIPCEGERPNACEMIAFLGVVTALFSSSPSAPASPEQETGRK